MEFEEVLRCVWVEIGIGYRMKIVGLTIRQSVDRQPWSLLVDHRRSSRKSWVVEGHDRASAEYVSDFERLCGLVFLVVDDRVVKRGMATVGSVSLLCGERQSYPARGKWVDDRVENCVIYKTWRVDAVTGDILQRHTRDKHCQITGSILGQASKALGHVKVDLRYVFFKRRNRQHGAGVGDKPRCRAEADSFAGERFEPHSLFCCAVGYCKPKNVLAGERTGNRPAIIEEPKELSGAWRECDDLAI